MALSDQRMVNREKCLCGIPLTRYEARPNTRRSRRPADGKARRVDREYGRAGAPAAGSVSGCGRKGPPKPIRQQLPVNAPLKLVAFQRALEQEVMCDAGAYHRSDRKMGRRVIALVHTDPELELVSAITHVKPLPWGATPVKWLVLALLGSC
jgi:hypothetical protein